MMTTTTQSESNGNRLNNGQNREKVTPASASAQRVQEWFNAQTLPMLPLHLELVLMGVWELEG